MGQQYMHRTPCYSSCFPATNCLQSSWVSGSVLSKFSHWPWSCFSYTSLLNPPTSALWVLGWGNPLSVFPLPLRFLARSSGQDWWYNLYLLKAKLNLDPGHPCLEVAVPCSTWQLPLWEQGLSHKIDFAQADSSARVSFMCIDSSVKEGRLNFHVALALQIIQSACILSSLHC